MTRRRTRTLLVTAAAVFYLTAAACSDDDDEATATTTTTASEPGDATGPDTSENSAGGEIASTIGRLSPLVEGTPVVANGEVFDMCGGEPQLVDLEPIETTRDDLEAGGFETRGTPSDDIDVTEDFGTDDSSAWTRVVKVGGTWLRVAAVTCAT